MRNPSKGERGHDLAAPHEPVAVKAEPLQLSPKMTVEAAFQAIANNCLRQVQANEAGVTVQHDIESVHQMRVGIRRLRSALGMFRDLVSCPDDMQAELRWLGTELGSARDWDVLAGSTLPRVGREIADDAVLSPVTQAVRDQAAAYHESAAAAISSARYATLILACQRWIRSAEWRAGLSAAQCRALDKPILGFADDTLLRDQQRLVKRGRRLAGATPEARHRVRIAAKKIRYASEFFASLYRASRVRPFVKALSRLQDELGWLNDIAVGARRMQELEASQPAMAASIGFVRGYLSCRIRSDDRELERLWKRFTPMPLPCKK